MMSCIFTKLSIKYHIQHLSWPATCACCFAFLLYFVSWQLNMDAYRIFWLLSIGRKGIFNVIISHLKDVCLNVYLNKYFSASGYIKGGWSLRKAWKLYEKCHEQITNLLQAYNIEYTVSTLLCLNIL